MMCVYFCFVFFLFILFPKARDTSLVSVSVTESCTARVRITNVGLDVMLRVNERGVPVNCDGHNSSNHEYGRFTVQDTRHVSLRRRTSFFFSLWSSQ